MATQKIGENGEIVAQVVQQIFAMKSFNVKCTKEKYEWTVLAGIVQGSTKLYDLDCQSK